MCGRYALRIAAPEIARILGLDTALEMRPRHNIAPTQPVAICRIGADGGRELVPVRWGLIPRWSRTGEEAYRLINARAGTVGERPAYRDAWRHRRCLVPADGWYEWQGPKGRRQAWFVHRPGHEPLCFAGLWERWRSPEGDAVDSCTILTTTASPAVAAIHPRMPVVLDPAIWATWLDPAVDDPATLSTWLRPWPDEDLRAYPVSSRVNDPRHEEEDCSAPLAGTVEPG